MKFYSLIAQEGEDGQIFCTCHLAAKDEQGLAEHRAACGGNVDDCQTEDLKIIKSEDGRTWRLLLVEDLTGCGGCCVKCGEEDHDA